MSFPTISDIPECEYEECYVENLEVIEIIDMETCVVECRSCGHQEEMLLNEAEDLAII